jgi:twitching motility protein PilT
LSQKLLPRAGGEGRVLATEVCVATPAIRNHIRDKSVHHIYSELQTGRKHKMQTMDQVLHNLYQKGEISYDTALTQAFDPNYIRHRSEEQAIA